MKLAGYQGKEKKNRNLPDAKLKTKKLQFGERFLSRRKVSKRGKNCKLKDIFEATI